MSDSRRRGGDGGGGGRRRGDERGGPNRGGRSGSKEDRRGGGGGKGYSSRRDRDHRRDKGRDGDNKGGEGGIKNRPVILKPPDRKAPQNDSEEFPTLAQAHASVTKSPTNEQTDDVKRSGSPAGVPTKVLLGRKESPLTRASESPAPEATRAGHGSSIASNTSKDSGAGTAASSNAAPPASEASGEMPFRDKCTRLIDEQLQFTSSGLGPVLTDNTDFLVVGVLGLQSSGKSTVANHLANHSTKKTGEGQDRVEVFREQTFDNVMNGEHGTSGVKAWISPTTRTILLDTQPLLSMSVLDRTMQVIDKKHDAEFGTLEATVELQSHQIMGFLMSVCHVVVLVQDHFVDPNLMEAVQTAEMLRPSSPALIGGVESGTVVEYFPELVIVHNKAKMDSDSGTLKDFDEFYKRVFERSQLKLMTGKVRPDVHLQDWRSNFTKVPWKMSEVNLFILPYMEAENDSDEEGYENDSDSSGYEGWSSGFDDHATRLRRKVVSIRPVNLTTIKLTEKLWLKFAEKTWDNIRNCSFYNEYSRLVN